MNRRGFSLLDQIFGMAMIAIISLLSIEVVNTLAKKSQTKENEYLQTIASAPTSQALWRYLSSSDLRTYAFSSVSSSSIAYRLWVPLKERSTDLSSSENRTTWMTANNGQTQAQSVRILCTERVGTQWYAFVPLWDTGKGELQISGAQILRPGTERPRSNRIDTNRVWSLIHSGNAYLFRISGSGSVYRWIQNTTTGAITLTEGDVNGFATPPMSCFGKGKIEQNGVSPSQAPLYPVLNSTSSRMLALPIAPLVIGDLVADSAMTQAQSASERVLVGYQGDAAETEIITLGADADEHFRVRICDYTGSGALGLSCDTVKIDVPHVDRMFVKLRTQLSMHADDGIERFNLVVEADSSDTSAALAKICDPAVCARLSPESQYAQFSDQETPTRYIASSFSTNKLESLRQVFVFLSEGDRIAHQFQIELIR